MRKEYALRERGVFFSRGQPNLGLECWALSGCKSHPHPAHNLLTDLPIDSL